MPPELDYPPRIPLAQLPTPLIQLPGGETGDARLWCKRDDLTGAALSGNKVRKLEYSLARARAGQADTLITCGGLQSNHCRATALVAAAQGMDCELILRGAPDDVDDGNLLLSRLAGANIATYSPDEYRAGLTRLLAQKALDVEKRGGRPYVIPTGASDGVGLWGYVAAARELAGQMASRGIGEPLVVCAAGSGGTLAGLAAGLQHYCPGARVLGIAVCDSAGYFLERVRQDVTQAQKLYPDSGLSMPDNFAVADDYIGPGYAQGYPAIYRTIKTVARRSGMILDPVYTAKAYYGMLQELRERQRARDVIFVHTGGIYGLFPFRETLQQG